MTEEWRAIAGWVGRYEVSSLGRVRSVPRLTVTARGATYRYPGVVLTPAIGGNGRPVVTLAHGSRRTSRSVHILVAEAFLGPCPDGLWCCHDDGDLLNNAASNLRWDTPSSNVHDEVMHGTHRNSRKTRCLRRHPLAHPNLYQQVTGSGSVASRCRACSLVKTQLRSRGRRNVPVDDPELKRLSDAKCDQLMPGWRDWAPAA